MPSNTALSASNSRTLWTSLSVRPTITQALRLTRTYGTATKDETASLSRLLRSFGMSFNTQSTTASGSNSKQLVNQATEVKRGVFFLWAQLHVTASLSAVVLSPKQRAAFIEALQKDFSEGLSSFSTPNASVSEMQFTTTDILSVHVLLSFSNASNVEPPQILRALRSAPPSFAHAAEVLAEPLAVLGVSSVVTTYEGSDDARWDLSTSEWIVMAIASPIAAAAGFGCSLVLPLFRWHKKTKKNV